MCQLSKRFAASQGCSLLAPNPTLSFRVGSVILLSCLLVAPTSASAAFVSGAYPAVLNRFNNTTGALEYSIPLAKTAVDLEFGPDGLLYAAIRDDGKIMRFDPATGSNLGVFASATGLFNSIAFMPNGDMLVASFSNNRVLRFNGTTGASMGVFASGGGLDGIIDIEFGTDGDLFASSTFNHKVVRFDGTTGAFKSTFVNGGGLNRPFGMEFNPEGDLLVTSALSDEVRRYDGSTGSLKDIFASGSGLDEPSNLAFGPGNDLFVATASLGTVFRFDGATGAFEGTFFSTPYAHAIAFAPVPEPSTIIFLALASLILPRSRGDSGN
jgi:WD40 repeat protein